MIKQKATAGHGVAFAVESVQHSSLTDGFGQALAVSGDTLAVGSLGPALSLYQRLSTGWAFQQILTTSCMASAVALDGGWLALRDGAPGMPGAVSTYRRSGTRWIARAVLHAPDPKPFDNFGYALALSGATLVASAQDLNHAAARCGSAYVFDRAESGWRFNAELRPVGADPRGEAYGVSVALDNDIAVVGAPPFAAYAFHRQGGAWVLEQRLTMPGLSTADGFGSSVAVDEDLIVVGDRNGGGAAVFHRASGTWQLAASSLGAFAVSVSVLRKLVAVGIGAPGESGGVLLYRPGKSGWRQVQRLLPPAGAPASFGSQVALGERLVAGSATDWATGRGAVYQFGPVSSEEGSSGRSSLHPALAAAVRRLGTRRAAARLLVLTPYPNPAHFKMINSCRMLLWGLSANGIHYTLHHPGIPRADLHAFDAVLSWAYGFKQRPAALASCLEFEAKARAAGIPVINSLASFSITHSSCLRAWHTAGIPCAPFQHVGGARDITLPFPVILRTDGVHRGKHMYLVNNFEEAEAVFTRASEDPSLPKPNLAIQFIDTRGPDGYFRKWRSHVIGSRVVPRQLQISAHWIVNLDGAKPIQQAVDEDRAFYRSGETNPEIVMRAAAALGSEIVALDYSRRGDDYVFWEGNRNFDMSLGGQMWRQFCDATGRSDAEAVQSVFRLANAIAGHVLDAVASRQQTQLWSLTSGLG
jgi:hypothetical protein